MAKSYELVRLYRSRSGMWIASLYNRDEGYFHDERFLWYSKKEVIRKLRQEMGVKVSREFCDGHTDDHGYALGFWEELTA